MNEFEQYFMIADVQTLTDNFENSGKMLLIKLILRSKSFESLAQSAIIFSILLTLSLYNSAYDL